MNIKVRQANGAGKLRWRHQLLLAIFLAVQAVSVQAVITPTQLAGNSLSEYPFFEYVKALIKTILDIVRIRGKLIAAH